MKKKIGTRREMPNFLQRLSPGAAKEMNRATAFIALACTCVVLLFVFCAVTGHIEVIVISFIIFILCAA